MKNFNLELIIKKTVKHKSYFILFSSGTEWKKYVNVVNVSKAKGRVTTGDILIKMVSLLDKRGLGYILCFGLFKIFTELHFT